MKTIELKAAARPETGKVASKHTRADGMAPGTLYTPTGAVHFTAVAKEMNLVTHSPDTFIVNLDIDGTVYTCILSECQYHALHGHLLTMDFKQVFPDKPVTVELPLDLVGRSPGVFAGGKLVQKARKMRVTGLYPNLPERIAVDITNLQLARTIKAGDLRYDNFRLAMKPDAAICSCELTRALRQEAQAAASKTPGKK